jgi:Fic family protein
MNTLRQLAEGEMQVPLRVTWYLSDIGRAQGLQDLFTRQSPQRLKVLREHAIAQSVVSSNRIEGVEVDDKRVGTVVFGHPALRDRDEEEVAGYRKALDLIHKQGATLPVAEEAVLELHRLSRGRIWDAGQYKEKQIDIIEKSPDGSERVRFRCVSPEDTPKYMRNLMGLWDEEFREKKISAFILLAAYNLDFLCIHPFRDGNGRVSRLLLLLTCYHCGLEVGRYISLERLIEEHKERYYETLEQSSRGWHEGTHDPWPYIGFVLFILDQAYKEFEQRVGALSSPKGAKTALIEQTLEQMLAPFSISELESKCPGVSRDMIRKVLKDKQQRGEVSCSGRGPAARWEKR